MSGGIRPFQPGEYVSNSDGSYSTERTVTIKDRSGKWVNVPSLWKDANGKTLDLGGDEGKISQALSLYESKGKPFQRFETVDDAVSFAQNRSNEGGAFSGSTLPHPNGRSANNMFNIMDLFGPGAVNRLLQPQQMQAPQNFLANPGAAQPGYFDPSRMGGQEQTNRPPAVGIEALVERLSGPMQVNGVAQVGSGAGQAAQGSAGIDPWVGKREEDVVAPDQWANMRQPGVDPMVTGASQSQAQPSAVRSSPFGGIDKAALNDIFTGWAMGSTPSESIARGAQLVAANRGTRQNVNQTVDWLKGKGMDEQQAKMLASSPPALNEYLKTLAAGNDPMKALQLQKAQLEIENLRNPTAKLTDDQREYQAAKDQGFEGTFMDYQVKMKEAGRSQINLDTGEKLPSGYRWVDPNDKTKGVQPIPGGPGEQIPGELAARVGMSESFAGQAPALRERLQSGEMTGPIDSLMGQFGMGDRGETYRQLQSGTDALMRLLTGAGMNETEARAYAERYLPTMKDTPDSAVGKLDQLMRELEAAKGMAMRGRGGNAATSGEADPLGLR